ncbi:methyltransferase family protein [Mesonia maritima]|uniref:Protein-S-isoprenylcysteine O-methyltransferase Ste14 n=1 Tax=Mesonia maritima TaxID=1793873 RepID=A0ABU1K7B6_9FLAO|nr:isoprenylcysteine carboxylmethyltransferase family protein [Mesonia maritima]MDR6301505.1 protein-S-isoprenylcysteine O-methyltransferase Ste14 [Mesonia maritima]
MALQEELEQQGIWLFKYRSFLPLVILFIGTTLYLRTEIYPETFFLEETPYEIYYEMACLFLSLLGLFIRVYTVGHTPKNTSGRNTTQGQVADTLNTSGMYSIVRHPLYVGNFLMWVGPAMLTGNLWFIVAFCLFYWIYYERIMYAEEQFLRRKFGNHYAKWAENVPAFVPNFRNFRKSNLPFSWKKVLKKEKNGLFALFLIFFIFDFSGELIENETDYNYFLIAMCLLTGISYIILKIIKKKTTLLNEKNR